MSSKASTLRVRNKRSRQSGDITLVIVEGHTEEKYFNDLARLYGSNTIVLRGQGTDPTSLVEYAIKIFLNGRQGNSRIERISAKNFPPRIFDNIFIVFDEDEKPEERNKAIAIIEEFSSKHKKVKITACDSRPNFELWILLHFEKLQPHAYTISDIDKKLRRHMENYSKSMDGLLSLIENQTSFAKENAKFLRDSIHREENDCFTNVDFFVEHCQKG